MRFCETPLAGAILVETESHADDRGSFYRSFCVREFEAHGLPGAFVQGSVSRNRQRGTLRGLHWQSNPHPEGKLVRCVRGAAYDVVVDLRPGSTTFCSWFGTELTDANLTALYIPPGFAHGFQTLCDDTDIAYQMTEFYVPELACGARWNDQAFNIRWPLDIAIMSNRDRSFKDFSAIG